MVAQDRISVHETVGRKDNCKLHFFSMYFVRNNKEIHLSFKNSEKQQTQTLKMSLLNLKLSMIYIIHTMFVLIKNNLHYLKDGIFECFFKE